MQPLLYLMSRKEPCRLRNTGKRNAPNLPGEVEIPLPEQYAVTLQIVSAIRLVAGVSHVMEF